MAAFTRKQYAGAAVPTTTTTLLTVGGTSVDILATTGWPSQAGVPFYIVVGTGTAFEEKCLATISGNTLTLTRAQDDTTAYEHAIGSQIYPVFTANDADEANELVSKLTTKGDLLVTDGNGLFRLGVGTDGFFLKANNSSSVGLEWASIPTINSLDDVGDVTITDLEAGDILTYSNSASAWVNETVHFLTVSDTEPTDEVQEGDLWYNSSELELYTYYSSTWVQVTLTPEFLKVEELDNVYIDTAYENDVLTFDGSDWYNANVTDLVIDGFATASVSFQDLSSETYTGNIVPSVHNTYTLGTSETRWADIYLGPGTLNITDNVTGANAGLTVADGVLQINGANQLQIGQLKFVDNNIESTSASVNIEIGQLASTGNLTLNRDVVLGTGKSLTFPDSSEQTTAFTGTANSLATARTIALSGDVSGSVSFDGSASVNISTTIQPNSVALGTDTTGNYMSGISVQNGLSVSHTPGEGSSATVGVDNALLSNFLLEGASGNSYGLIGTSAYLDVKNTNGYNKEIELDISAVETQLTTDGYLKDSSTSSSVSFARLQTSGDVVVGGDLTVNGTTTTLNTETLLVEDNIVVLNSGITASPTLNSGIEVERGTSDNVSMRWNESTDRWEFTNDGSAYNNVLLKSDISLNDISDTVITSAANGQLLEFDGTNWVNAVRPSSEPMGHENKADSVISFNEGTRTFSIAPASISFTVWCAGKRFVKTTTETVQIPDTSGLYYIYYNSSGVLSYRTTYFVWNTDAPTAYVYWNEVDNKAYFFADERHGVTLDWATHEYLHRTRGAAIANGFGANNYILNGNGASDTHAKIDIANGTFFDEDLQVDIAHSATPTANTWEQVLQGNAEIPVFYRLNNHWVKDSATEFPMKQGTDRPGYNLNTAGTWSTPDVANNRFGVSWIIATNNLNEPVIAILGQGSYTDNGSAQAEFYASLDLDGFPIVEFRPLYKIIYECKTSYTNTPSARITDVIDLRSVISSDQGVGTTPVSDHGSMTGLADDDHTQYLTDARHDALDHTTAIGSASLDDIGNVSASAAASGDFLKYDGANWVNDPINLGTDTVGNYMVNVSASTGISISHTQGEGSTATISTTGVQTLGAKAGNYTLAAGDAAETIIIMDSSSANDLTVPSASVVTFGTGTSITVVQRGTGKTRVLAGAGVTLLATPGVYLRARYSSCTLVKTENANEWFVIGDLAAS